MPLRRRSPIPVATDRYCGGRGSNSRPLDGKSDALTTRLPSHSFLCQKRSRSIQLQGEVPSLWLCESSIKHLAVVRTDQTRRRRLRNPERATNKSEAWSVVSRRCRATGEYYGKTVVKSVPVVHRALCSQA